MVRLQRRQTVLWDGMGLFSARHGWMAALLASFLALFVLASAVEAATCSPEAVSSHAAQTVVDAPSDPDDGAQTGQHAICSHGHCHHSGAAAIQTPDALTRASIDSALAPLPPVDRLASRKPAGPDRPPRG